MTCNVRVYSTEICPKCRVLKSTLKSLGVDFEERDMSDKTNMLHLMAYDGFPADAGAPTLEIIDPDGYEAPICYTHHVLFERGKINLRVVREAIGKGQKLKSAVST